MSRNDLHLLGRQAWQVVIIVGLSVLLAFALDGCSKVVRGNQLVRGR